MRRLAALSGVGLLLFGAELWMPGSGAPGDESSTPPWAAEQPPAAVLNVAEWAQTVLARPLFNPDRRPTLGPAAVLPAPAQPQPPRLSGTIVSARGVSGHGERMAVLVPAGSEHPLTVREGDQTGAFRVVGIAPGEVTAEGPSGRLTLRVRFGGLASAGPALAEKPDSRERGPRDQDE